MSMISKNEKVKRTGSILQGVGLIFIGMNVMSGSVGGLMTEKVIENGVAVSNPIAQAVKDMFVAIGLGKKVLTWEIPVLFLLGAALTGLMQSSAAITAIVISLASSGLISLPMAMFIILGTNVGTCVTALLSSLGTNVNARRTAVVHLLFSHPSSKAVCAPVRRRLREFSKVGRQAFLRHPPVFSTFCRVREYMPA